LSMLNTVERPPMLFLADWLNRRLHL